MDGYSQPTKESIGDVLDHDTQALNAVKLALSVLKDLECTIPDAEHHVVNAERELRAAARALKSLGA